MKRQLIIILLLIFLPIRAFSIEFILSDYNKEILSRTDDYNPVKFCFIEDNLVLFDFCRSEILINNEWHRLFDNRLDREVIELSNKYRVSTSVYLDSEKRKLYFEIKDGLNEENCFYYEFMIENEKLIKKEFSREEFSKIKELLISFWQELPFKLDDNSEIQFLKENVNYVTSEYKRIFQVVKKDKVIFDFIEEIQDYKILTKPYINDKKNKLVFLGCNKDAKKGFTGYCKVFIFSIIYDATINDSRVRFRSEPNLSCETLGYFEKGNTLKIVDRTDEKFNIDGEEWYWYQVKTDEGTIGWVYGKYLDIEK